MTSQGTVVTSSGFDLLLQAPLFARHVDSGGRIIHVHHSVKRKYKAMKKDLLLQNPGDQFLLWLSTPHYFKRGIWPVLYSAVFTLELQFRNMINTNQSQRTTFSPGRNVQLGSPHHGLISNRLLTAIQGRKPKTVNKCSVQALFTAYTVLAWLLLLGYVWFQLCLCQLSF